MQNPQDLFKWSSGRLQSRGIWFPKESITICTELIGVLLFQSTFIESANIRSSTW